MSLFWSQWAGDFYSEQWIGRLATSWRADVVRIALGVEPDGYLRFPDREMEKVRRTINAAIAQSLYVIVNWHAHEKRQDETMCFFDMLSRTYGKIPNIIYEPWNEPSPRFDWSKDIRPYHEAVIDLIRSNGANGHIIAGTGSHCRDVDLAAMNPLEDANTSYALHFYAGTHRAGLRLKAAQAIAAGVCLFVSEYGLCEASGDGEIDLLEADRWWSFMDDYGISHVNWAFNDKDEACSVFKTRSGFAALIPGRVLTRPGRHIRNHLRSAWARERRG